jgi:hypothetical protein
MGYKAVLEIAKHLSGAWPILCAFKIIPRFLRDAVLHISPNTGISGLGKVMFVWCLLRNFEISF